MENYSSRSNKHFAAWDTFGSGANLLEDAADVRGFAKRVEWGE